MYGPQAALIAESFPPRLRYSGASLGYQLASVIAGGPAPLIATWLFARYHSGYAIALYILACAIISLVAAARLKDYTNKDISEEYDAELEARVFQAAADARHFVCNLGVAASACQLFPDVCAPSPCPDRSSAKAPSRRVNGSRSPPCP